MQAYRLHEKYNFDRVTLHEVETMSGIGDGDGDGDGDGGGGGGDGGGGGGGGGTAGNENEDEDRDKDEDEDEDEDENEDEISEILTAWTYVVARLNATSYTMLHATVLFNLHRTELVILLCGGRNELQDCRSQRFSGRT
ncbi:hypothetical protein V1477_009190, partial [Vespula maculifrons]